MAFVPVLCGSAFKNKGVQPLLNAVVDYLPGPLDVPAYGICRETKAKKELKDQRMIANHFRSAFKIMNDPFVGSLTFTRIYSGL